MNGNFDACLDEVLKLEGGWSDNPIDKGGPTNLGVTLETWRTFVGKNRVVTAADIKALTRVDVEPLYAVFWKGCSGNYLPKGVDLATFDWCVNSGVKRGNQGLQEALGVGQDGLVGPVTIKAAVAMDPAVLVNRICDRRTGFYESLPVEQRAEFLKGWIHRVEIIRAVAMTMVEKAPAQ